MLHILSRSPWQFDIKELFRMIKNKDDLLFIQDGVVAIIEKSYFINLFNQIPLTRKLFALKVDVEARGISDKISKNINLINYNCFVDLVIKHKNQISW